MPNSELIMQLEIEFLYCANDKDWWLLIIFLFYVTFLFFLVFVYGATGAGKTFTMLGKRENNPGIMYHTMAQLYQEISAVSNEKECHIGVSFVEVSPISIDVRYIYFQLLVVLFFQNKIYTWAYYYY